MADTAAASAPLMENEHVKELFTIMRDNHVDTGNLSAMINYVARMEQHLETATSQLIDMKRELAGMREIQNHPIKTALQNTIKNLERKINELRGHIAEVKSAIIDGAKNAVAAFKEKGASALNKVMSFFHIKSGLQSVKENINDIIKMDDKAIAKIEAFAVQYHETGKGLKNMARALSGKEPVQDAKAVGKMARAMQAPYKADRAILVSMRKAVNAVIRSLDQLEQGVTERAAAKKPSLQARLDENKERVARETRDRPTPERTVKKDAVAV